MMERYKKYKNSGVEWIGEIPDGWEVKKLKYIGESIIGLTYQPSEVVQNSGTLVLRSSNIQNCKLSLNDCVYVDKEIPEKLKVRKGDILICSRNGSRALIGKNITIDESIEGSTFGAFMTLFRTDKFEFISKYFNSQVFSGQSGLFLTATINQLTINTINNFFVALPPESEQTTIANYLDRKTAEIDKLIAQKERLLELYEEEKTAIINQAVTQGINPDVKLKESGVDWLREIPEHWEVKKSRYLFEIKKRIVGELGFDILSITQKGIKVKDIKSKNGQIASDYSKYQLVEKDDFAMNHMDLLTGYVDISKHVGVTSPDYRVFTLTDKKSMGGYYLYLFQIGYKNKIFYAFGRGAAHFGRWRFPADEFKNFSFPCPPLKEQEAINKHIETEIPRINAKISKTKKLVALQKEYRTALISEVVTGKIKVIQKKYEEITA